MLFEIQCHFNAQLIHDTAIIANTIAPEAMNTANDCQKVRLAAKNARYNVMKAIHPKIATTVPAILAPSLFIFPYLSFHG